MQLRIDSNPSKEKIEMANVIIRKIHITLFDVVNIHIVNRPIASNPKNAAVQCSNNMKWLVINVTETIKQATIFVLSLNWKERMSKQMAIPIRICDKIKLDSNSIPMSNVNSYQIKQFLNKMSQQGKDRAKTQ